jgi:hypothetical protein
MNPDVAVSILMVSALEPVPKSVATDGLMNFTPWVALRVRPVTVSM